MSTPINTNDEYDVAIAGDLCVIKCWAEWCGPCVAGAQAFEDVAAEMPTVPFYTLDINSMFDFAHIEQVTKLPTFLVARHGEIIYEISGASNLATIRTALTAFGA